ncbi:hypothetical protein IQ06DRAFT_339832 [Phaeosphaeriaceae sp. SRC1lsM3a]|nr:hypothetical protein IQ06DRAFT_339832 [Stagonospora sp. SRC1lsM3a]
MRAIYCAAVPEDAHQPASTRQRGFGVETDSATAVAAPGAATTAPHANVDVQAACGSLSRGLPVAAVLRTGSQRQIPPCAPMPTLASHSLPPAARDMRLSRYRSDLLGFLPQPGYPSACSWAVNRVPAAASESTLATLPASSHGLSTPSSESSSTFSPESSASIGFTVCGRSGSGAPVESIVLPSQFDIRSTRRIGAGSLAMQGQVSPSLSFSNITSKLVLATHK